MAESTVLTGPIRTTIPARLEVIFGTNAEGKSLEDVHATHRRRGRMTGRSTHEGKEQA